ncbi:MAG TPA: hypothetical protein VGD91_10760 [Trebonia sp.]
MGLRQPSARCQRDPEQLIGFCRGELAAYKYPRRVEVLPELPKTPTGKLLRRELRQRAADGPPA